MIKQDIDKLEHLLDQNIEKFLANGGNLCAGSFGNGNDLCCAISATTRTHTKLPELSRQLGAEVLHDEMFAITNGFDLTPFDQVRSEYGTGEYPGEIIDDATLYALYTVGKNLRTKYMVKP